MTLKGTFRDGVIVPDRSDGLREGDVVRIVRKTSKKPTPRKPAKRAARPAKKKPPLFGFGMLKDKPEWKGKSTLQIARELRRRAMGERYRG